MKMQYRLNKTTGRQLVVRLFAAIGEEEVGFDSVFNSKAVLLVPEGGQMYRCLPDGYLIATANLCGFAHGDMARGPSWITAWSGFRYTILNPESDKRALVEYEGAYRGFLSQNLLPDELGGETAHAVVLGGSALEKHGMDKFTHANARLLAKAYGLMRAADKCSPGRDNLFAAVVAAIEAAREISAYMCELGIHDDSWANAGPGTTWSGSLRNHGDPSVFVVCCPGGRQVKSEFPLNCSTYVNRDRSEVVEEANNWLDRLRPVFT